MRLRRFRTHALLALLAFACAWFWNSWNVEVLRDARPDLLRESVTVTTTDDTSYLKVVEELVDPPAVAEKPRVDLRAPGYRLWYLIPRLFLPAPEALRVLVVLQCLLFAFSVTLLWEVFLVFGVAPFVRWTFALLIAVMPMFHGFLFHTITEGVTPALSLGTLCSALLARRPDRNGWLFAALALWSLITVTRPVLIWVGLPVVQVLWSRFAMVRALLLCALAFVPTGIWWLHNMTKAGGYMSLHPIYRADEPGITRPTHGAFWELGKSWGMPGDSLHSIMEPAFQNALVGDTSAIYAQRFIATAPANTLSAEQVSRITSAFSAWQRFTAEVLAPALARPERALGPQPEEERIIDQVDAITKAYRKEHAWRYHIAVPINILRKMIAHSNLNLYLFQQALRGRGWVEALRWFSAIVHILLLSSLFIAVWWRMDHAVRLAALGAVLYLLYLAYVQRGVEERYTLPVLHMAVLVAGFMTDGVFKAIASWRGKVVANS